MVMFRESYLVIVRESITYSTCTSVVRHYKEFSRNKDSILNSKQKSPAQ